MSEGSDSGFDVLLELPLPQQAPGAPEPVPTFETGGAIPCRLSIRSGSGCSQSRCILRLQYRCHGSGTPETVVAGSCELALPALGAGEHQVVTVELAAPAAGPPSYCGEHVKIDWSVVFQAPGRRPCETPIHVRPARRRP
ncbi:MAG: hypothetical protein HY816_18375 [Candidatus Wallbacteria bacterium]|nr:hypothetical protein [Candidatus Wallbacteria bacterium]